MSEIKDQIANMANSQRVCMPASVLREIGMDIDPLIPDARPVAVTVGAVRELVEVDQPEPEAKMEEITDLTTLTEFDFPEDA